MHVVAENSGELSVTLSDKKVLKAKVLGFDKRNDLALIKVSAGRKLPTLPLGDSDHLVVGQKVLAIGNPFQFEGTLDHRHCQFARPQYRDGRIASWRA